MNESIREKIGIDKDDFVFVSVMSVLLLIGLIAIFVPFITANPVLSVVTLGFILVLGSSVHLLRKYLEVRKLEAQPSAEEQLKRQYVENEDLDIENYGEKYEKLKEIEKK
jgi:hypothetical protein